MTRPLSVHVGCRLDVRTTVRRQNDNQSCNLCRLCPTPQNWHHKTRPGSHDACTCAFFFDVARRARSVSCACTLAAPSRHIVRPRSSSSYTRSPVFLVHSLVFDPRKRPPRLQSHLRPLIRLSRHRRCPPARQEVVKSSRRRKLPSWTRRVVSQLMMVSLGGRRPPEQGHVRFLGVGGCQLPADRSPPAPQDLTGHRHRQEARR